MQITGVFHNLFKPLFPPIFAAHFYNVQYTIMSIIQQIREKYAAVSIAVIALDAENRQTGVSGVINT